MKALLLLNPSAGRSHHQTMRKAIQAQLTIAGITCILHETQPGEHVGDVVRRKLGDGIDVVLAAGGDGTVAGAGDGLIGTDIPLGIIPAGTANYVSRELGIPQSVDAAVRLIAANPVPIKIDAMRIGGRIYLLNVGMGISAAVIGNTSSTSKKRFGFVAYVATALAKLLTVKPRRFTVVVDDHTHTYHAVEILVNNCGVLTKRLYPRTPDIRVDDQHLDVWVMSTQALLDYPKYLLATIFGRQPKLEAEFLQAEHHISIYSQVPLPVQADGDIIGTTPVEVELLPQALTVLTPGGIRSYSTVLPTLPRVTGQQPRPNGAQSPAQ